MWRPSASGTCNTCLSYRKTLAETNNKQQSLEVREEDIDKGHGHSGQDALKNKNDPEADGNGGEKVGRGADVGKQSDGEGGSAVENHGEFGSSDRPFDSIKAIKKAIDNLSKGALAELVSLKPMTSTAELQHNTAQPVSPTKSHANTLKIILMTQNEMLLLTALPEAEAQEWTTGNQYSK